LSVGIAQLLTSRDRFADVVTVLADVAPRRDDAEVYMLLGYSLGMQGRRAEGLALLERARDMQPTNLVAALRARLGLRGRARTMAVP
jgi:Flp pilus assembly protein TadD